MLALRALQSCIISRRELSPDTYLCTYMRAKRALFIFRNKYARFARLSKTLQSHKET